jgi:hypothetical protein
LTEIISKLGHQKSPAISRLNGLHDSRIQEQPKRKPSFPIIEHANHIPDPAD